MRAAGYALAAALVGAASLTASPPAEAVPSRSSAVVRAFMKVNPCPATGATRGACPGHVVDHIQPLCADGADSIENLQWQTVPEAKEKDRWERQYCRFRRARLPATSGV